MSEFRIKPYDTNRHVDDIRVSLMHITEHGLLVVRSEGNDEFNTPGGTVKPGEKKKGALVREVLEELGITVCESTLAKYCRFDLLKPSRTVRQVIYTGQFEGIPTIGREITARAWVTNESDLPIKPACNYLIQLLRQGKLI